MEDFKVLSGLTERIIGCAIQVHRHLGPGFRESTYETALCVELEIQGLRALRQVVIPVSYKGHPVAEHRLDLLVEDQVIVEVKSTADIHSLFEAQLLAYLRAANMRVGLLINFNTRLLRDGIRRMVL